MVHEIGRKSIIDAIGKRAPAGRGGRGRLGAKFWNATAAATIEGGNSLIANNPEDAASGRGRKCCVGIKTPGVPAVAISHWRNCSPEINYQCAPAPRGRQLLWCQICLCPRGRNHRRRQAAP